MPDLQHIKPGEPIRASMLNKVIDGAKIALDSQTSGGGSLPGFDVSNTVVRTLVQTDKPLPRYAVVSIDGALINPNKNKSAFLQAPAIRAGKPSADTANFAILQRPASPNQVVPACVSGVSIVELSVVSAEHEFAVPNDSFTMTSAESGGAKILWKQDSPGKDGKTWALVSFPATVGGTAPADSQMCTVVLPICRAINRNSAENKGRFVPIIPFTIEFCALYDEYSPVFKE